jgi:hypothetical protein
MPPQRKALLVLVIIFGALSLISLTLYLYNVITAPGQLLAETFQGVFQAVVVAFTVLLGILLASHPPKGVPPYL